MCPSFTEDWFSGASCEALAGLAASTNHMPGVVVEIGSWEGRSTMALARAVVPSVVRAVDTWQGSIGEISEVIARDRDIFSTFTANTAGLNVHPYRMDWRLYFDNNNERLRFCFIDGLHTYEEVRDQLAVIRPRMLPGGIICGDDNHHPPIQQAVIEAFGNAPVTATLWWVQL